MTGFTIFYYTTNAMQNKGKFPSAPTAEISVVQECGSVYNEEWIVPICGTDNE